MTVYKDGVAITDDGAIVINALGAAAVPATAQPLKGAVLQFGKAVAAADRALYVRFV